MPWRRTETAADYAAAVVPLEEAHQHSHSHRLSLRSDSEGQADGDAFDSDGGIDKDLDEQDTTMLMTGSEPPEYSIEGLRKEVRRGGRGKKWTAYESEWPRLVVLLSWGEAHEPTVKSRLINKAIQDIGMGRYNWQLFVLCGFGWFADKYVPRTVYELPG